MQIIVNKEIRISEFTAKDIITVYKLRNLKSVRSKLLHKNFIPIREHINWINKNVFELKRVQIFIVYIQNKPAGLFIKKKLQAEDYEMEIMIKTPEAYPLLAALSLAAFCQVQFNYYQYANYYSYIAPDNPKAIQLLTGLGAEIIASDKENLLRLHWLESRCLQNNTYKKILRRLSKTLQVQA